MTNRPTPPTASESERIAARVAREDHLSFRSGNTPAETSELCELAMDLVARMTATHQHGKYAATAELARRLQSVVLRVKLDSQRQFAESGE